jgi:site-specific recombinase XerD
METPAHLTHSTTQTITVRKRHGSKNGKACPEAGKPLSRRCKCRLEFYFYKNGRDWYKTAGTRSWEEAERKAQLIRDEWDPIHQKLKALQAEKVEKDLAQVTIEFALDQWLAMRCSKLENEDTRKKYVTAAGKIAAWAKHVDPHHATIKNLANQPRRLRKEREFIYCADITRESLDQWRLCWSADAIRVGDRLGNSAAAQLLEKIKMFTAYCVDMGWIKSDPAARMDPIKPDEDQTLPLDRERYEQVIAATFLYDEDMRPDDRFGAELRALIELQRWTGLRISDAVKAARGRLHGNVYTLRMTKGGAPLTVILPDHVVEMLNSLPHRDTVDPRYFFWSGKSKTKSVTGMWQRKLSRLNQYLTLMDYEDNPQPIRFHSHLLRDSFAVEHLLAGTRMEDVQKMLGHKKIAITEKYYAAWVPRRQKQLEEKMRAGLEKQGMKVTFSAA